jgi:hypothetical protein
LLFDILKLELERLRFLNSKEDGKSCCCEIEDELFKFFFVINDVIEVVFDEELNDDNGEDNDGVLFGDLSFPLEIFDPL